MAYTVTPAACDGCQRYLTVVKLQCEGDEAEGWWCGRKTRQAARRGLAVRLPARLAGWAKEKRETCCHRARSWPGDAPIFATCRCGVNDRHRRSVHHHGDAARAPRVRQGAPGRPPWCGRCPVHASGYVPRRQRIAMEARSAGGPGQRSSFCRGYSSVYLCAMCSWRSVVVAEQRRPVADTVRKKQV
jgi:hypothetical protein